MFNRKLILQIGICVILLALAAPTELAADCGFFTVGCWEIGGGGPCTFFFSEGTWMGATAYWRGNDCDLWCEPGTREEWDVFIEWEDCDDEYQWAYLYGVCCQA